MVKSENQVGCVLVAASVPSFWGGVNNFPNMPLNKIDWIYQFAYIE